MGAMLLCAATRMPLAGAARACVLDGVPSLRADGLAAVLNRQAPVAGTLGHWSPFVFAHVYHIGRTIRFSENVAELARTLPPEIVHGRWIWRLGDGRVQQGSAVAHRLSLIHI